MIKSRNVLHVTRTLNFGGIEKMMLILGIGFFVVVVALAQFLKVPHVVMQYIKGYGDIGEKKQKAMDRQASIDIGVPVEEHDFSSKEMLCTVQFYMLWFMYACGAGAGLMIISVAKKIVNIHVAESMAIAAVVGLAIGNGGGRILAGMLSDKIGRKATLFICFILQAVLIFLLSQASEGSVLASGPALILITALIGANYGSNLALFPSFTKDFYGLKNFGMNYGLVFTSWGVGGFMLARLAGMMYDKYQTFTIAYYGASVLLVLAAVMVFFVKQPHHAKEAVVATEPATQLIENVESPAGA